MTVTTDSTLWKIVNQVFWPCRVVSTQPCGTVSLWHCWSTLSEAMSSLYFAASTRLVNYTGFTKPTMHTAVLWLQQGRHPKYISLISFENLLVLSHWNANNSERNSTIKKSALLSSQPFEVVEVLHFPGKLICSPKVSQMLTSNLVHSPFYFCTRLVFLVIIFSFGYTY